MSETTVIELPDGNEMEVPSDAPKEEVRRRIGNYLKTLPPETIDAIPTKTRLVFGLGQGAVAAQARKNLANIQAEQAQAQTEEDRRNIRSQYIREVATPAMAAGVTLLTGGAAAPAAAALMGGTMGAGELLAQTSSPGENVVRDVAGATALGAASEFGGRLIGSSLAKMAGGRAAAKAAATETERYADLAERLGFPLKNVEGRAGSGLQARVDAARRTAVSKAADEIMKPFGSPITAEIAGQEAAGVLKNVESSFAGNARAMRGFIKDVAGDVPAPLRETIFKSAELKNELGKRAFRGKEDLDVFFNAMVDENGSFKKFSLDELLALRTDVGKELGRASESNPKRAFLKRLYGAMTDDAEAILDAKDPNLGRIFRQANKDLSEYHAALKNEVASRLMSEANAGNGSAVVRELFKADPADVNHVFQFVQSMRPQEAMKFRRTMQQAALQNIFGVAEDGAPAIGFKLAERMDKIGADRLSVIFGGSKESAEALSRVKELAELTSRFERSLKVPPDMSRQVDSGVKRLIAQAGVALGAKAWGAPYAAARIGAEVLRGAGDLVMAELAVRRELFRGFKAGYQKMASAVSLTNLSPQARAALTSGGEKEIKRALTGAASLAAIKLRTQPKAEQKERAEAAKNQPVTDRYAPAKGFSNQI